MEPKNKLLIFDVEATDLHGIGFAVGAIVIEGDQIVDSFGLNCWRESSRANAWVKENVLPAVEGMTRCPSLNVLYDSFFGFLSKHHGAEVWADVGWPVETNFLSAIVRQDPSRAEFMPYPLYDVSQFVPVDMDRYTKAVELVPGLSMRRHHPVDDCIASWYCLRWRLGILHEAVNRGAAPEWKEPQPIDKA